MGAVIIFFGLKIMLRCCLLMVEVETAQLDNIARIVREEKKKMHALTETAVARLARSRRDTCISSTEAEPCHCAQVAA